MVESKNRIIIVFLLFVLVVFLVQIKMYIGETHATLYKRLEESAVKNMHEVALNIDQNLKNQIENNLFDSFKDNRDMRREFEKDLSLFVTSKVQYIYLIYKDEKNRFRFLADGSTQDKARFNQKLDVSEKYEEIYKTKEELVVTQNFLEKLSITYIYPIIRNNNVQALLVFDFSTTLTSELYKILKPIQTLFTVIYVMIGMLIFITIIQGIYFYQIRKKSFIDPLTQIYNRQYLRDMLDNLDISMYHILMVDFDYFKKVNDHYGHSVGDKVLFEGAQLMQNTLRKEDYLFRYGGEEFLILLHNDETKTTEDISQRIRKTIKNHIFLIDNIKIQLTVSIGLNIVPHQAKNVNEAIKIADMMLYKAKSKGRNRVVSNSSMMQINIDEKYVIGETIDRVKSAIEDDRIICHFHEIIDKNNQIHKYEALVRCVDEEGNTIYPNHFLSDIMYTSVYIDLTKRIIDICIDTVKNKNVPISINFSVNDLLNEDLMQYFIEKLEVFDGKSSQISIEILEDDEVHNITELKKVIDQLKVYGIAFAIDDFGSGYANYNYLAELNIDYIKIDGSLIQNVLESQNTRHIIKSIIKLAQDMKLKTIAEFVSNEEIYDEMINLGVDYMQGYYMSKPISVEEI